MKNQPGFSLVEALVALTILAFGLISVAAMQLKALHSASTGYQHSLANVAAIDAQERLWIALADSQTCSSIPLSSVASAWQSHWFLDHSTAVLPQADALLSNISASGCQFTVTVYLPSKEDDQALELVYEFRLPSPL